MLFWLIFQGKEHHIMKKIRLLTLITILALSLSVLTACSGGNNQDLSDSKYVGTWKAVAMEIAGESVAPDSDWILTVNGDGTGTLAAEDTSNFTWQPTKDGFKTKGDVKATFKEDGDRLTTKVIGVNLVFERQ